MAKRRMKKRVRITQHGRYPDFYYKIDKKNVFGVWKTQQKWANPTHKDTPNHKVDIVFKDINDAKKYINVPPVINVVYEA